MLSMNTMIDDHELSVGEPAYQGRQRLASQYIRHDWNYHHWLSTHNG